MAFAPKIDYCGLVVATKPSTQDATSPLVIRDANENVSVEKYQPNGQDGSFVGTEIFGQDSAPSNSYGLQADMNIAAGAIKLNKITTIGEGATAKKYALESFEITTAAGAAPAISATCQEIEAGATDDGQCVYSVPAFTLTKKHHAQILFAAFTLEGAGCELTACSATVGGSINKDKVEGVKVSSDINSGVITVSGTVLQTGAAAPTIAAADGWVLTQPLNCTNPEAAYKSYTFELQKVLTKTQPTQAANGGGSSGSGTSA